MQRIKFEYDMGIPEIPIKEEIVEFPDDATYGEIQAEFDEWLSEQIYWCDWRRVD